METIKRKSGLRFREKVYFEGKAIKSPLFRSKTEAKRWKRNLLQERDKLRALGISRIDNRTFSEYSSEWLIKKSDREKKTIEGYTSILNKWLLPEFGKFKMKNLTLSHAESFRTGLIREKKISRVRINHVLKVLKMIAKDAEKNGTLVKNPFLSLDYLRVQAKNRVYWLPREINQFLLANHDDYYFPVYCFLLNTGIRPSELRGLMWDKVDFERGLIEISRSLDRHGIKETTKSKKPREIPMNKVVRELLISLSRSKPQLKYVFTQYDGSPISMHFGDRHFLKAVSKAKVRKIQFRHLRSTYASNFVMNGGDIFTLSKILGHHSVQVTEQRYADLHPSFLKKEAEIVSFSLETEHITGLKLV